MATTSGAAADDVSAGEGTALLGIRHHTGVEGDSMYPSPSDVIERTSVLFQPDFSRVPREDAVAVGFVEAVTGGFVEQRTIGIALAASRPLSSEMGSGNYKHETILETCGMNTMDLEMGMTNSAEAKEMIGAITTTSILNLVAATASGIGMVVLPGSFARAGWLTGILLFLVAGASSAGSLFLLDWACNAVNARGRQNGNSRHRQSRGGMGVLCDGGSLHDGDGLTSAVPSENTSSSASLVRHALGKPGSLTLHLVNLMSSFGQMVAYLGAIGGQVASLLSLTGINGMGTQVCTWMVALVVVLPLSLLPGDGALRFAGMLGFIGVTIIAGTIVAADGMNTLAHEGLCVPSQAAIGDQEPKTTSFAGWIPLLKAAPIFLISLNASLAYIPIRFQHQSCLGRLLSLVAQQRSTSTLPLRESVTVVWTSLILVGSLYLLGSGVAYLTYCDGAAENVLDNWSIAWVPGSLVRLWLVIELTAEASGIFLPVARGALWYLWYDPYGEQVSRGSPWLEALVSLGLVVTGAIGSLLVGGAIALPLAVTGALCSTVQVFLLPGLVANKLLGDLDREASHPRAMLFCERFAAVGFATIGGIWGILSLAALFGILG